MPPHRPRLSSNGCPFPYPTHFSLLSTFKYFFYRNFPSTQQLFTSSNLLYLKTKIFFFPVIRRLAEYSAVTGPCLYEIALRAHKALYAKTHYMLFAKILQLIHLKESGSAD
jgi:hypothetical protein